MNEDYEIKFDKNGNLEIKKWQNWKFKEDPGSWIPYLQQSDSCRTSLFIR